MITPKYKLGSWVMIPLPVEHTPTGYKTTLTVDAKIAGMAFYPLINAIEEPTDGQTILYTVYVSPTLTPISIKESDITGNSIIYNTRFITTKPSTDLTQNPNPTPDEF